MVTLIPLGDTKRRVEKYSLSVRGVREAEERIHQSLVLKLETMELVSQEDKAGQCSREVIRTATLW